MQAVFNHLEFRLGHNQAFALSRAATAAITVLTGNIWITQDGDPNDHVLAAGQTLRVGGDAQVVVAALSPARVSVDSPRAVHGPAARIGRRAKAWYLRLMHRLSVGARPRSTRLILY